MPAAGGRTGARRLRVVDSFSRIVRLGEGLAATGALSEAAMDRTSRRSPRAPSGCGAAPSAAWTPSPPRPAAALPTARPSSVRAAAETGLRPRIITAREEAELAMESCAPLLTGQDRRALLFDIGGGSTEIAWIRTGATPELIGTISLPCGVVTLSERDGHDCYDARGFREVVDDVAARLDGFDRLHCIGQEIRRGGVRLIGTSGTVTTLAGIVLDLPRYRRQLVDGLRLDAAAADTALDRLFAMGRAGLAAHPCVGPERADFVLPGCAVYAAIRRYGPFPS
jgi:exopolyphosphatase/guanosine-5'-triphosphate,3'-diphosphate pyrophosphatase